jgi:hypothetical protein
MPNATLSLTVRVLSLVCLVGALVVPRLAWRRAAFGGFIALGLCSFPLRAGWPARPLVPTACEWLVGRELALFSFHNTPHIVLFALCFLLARVQFPASGPGRAARWRANVHASTTTMIVGALVELAEGFSGAGHCRLRDLLPDAAGALLGWAAAVAFITGWTRWAPRGHGQRAAA